MLFLYRAMMWAQARSSLACHRDPGMGEMYAIVRSEALLAGRLAALAHQVPYPALRLI